MKLQSRHEGRKLDLLQIFRGLAALAVLLHHTTGQALKVESYPYLNNFFHLGWSGVDFFFVLSGFIIFYIHRQDVGVKSRVQNFLIKRVIRLFPIYWVMTIGVLAIFFLYPQFGLGHERHFSTIIQSALLFPQQPGHIVGVAWSLSHELLFYILFAVAIGMSRYVAIPLIIGWILLSTLCASKLVDVSESFYLSFLFSAYNFEFLFGCLSAFIVLNHRVMYPKTLLCLGLGLFVFTLYALALGELQRSVIWTTVLFGLSGALIISAAAQFEFSATSLWVRLGVLLGDASYSIYLIHFYIIIFLYKLHAWFPIPNFAYATLVVFTSLTFGIMMYKYIELPMLTYLKSRYLGKNSPAKIGKGIAI